MNRIGRDIENIERLILRLAKGWSAHDLLESKKLRAA